MHHIDVTISSDRFVSSIPGGIGRYSSELAAALSRCLDSPPRVVAPPRLGIGVSVGAAAWQFLKFPRIEVPADIVHATSLAIPPVTKPLVVTIHDLAFEKWPQCFTAWGVAFHERGLRMAAAKAEVVITPTRAVANELEERHPEFKGRVVSIHHGVPSFCIASDAPSDEGRHSNAVGVTDRPYFLWVGTIEPRKNLSRLVRAFALVSGAYSDVTLVLAGKRGWNMRREALLGGSLASRLKDRVVFVDDPSDATLRSLYEKAIALTYPSLDEGFGFPPLEAMALGTPVIASDIYPIKEVVGEAAVLVDPKRVGSIADAMEAILTDEKLTVRLRDAGLLRAAKFTWDESASSHVRTYQAAIDL